MSADLVRVSVAVAVPPALAFTVFTDEIDRWWRRGPKFRQAGRRGGFVRLEPRVGGRLFESIDSEDGEVIFEVARGQGWDPPVRLAFSWRNANFTPDEVTNVTVEFVSTASGTLVTVTHVGWGALRADHPARHGLQGAAFSRMIGLWWGDQMTSLRELCRPA